MIEFEASIFTSTRKLGSRLNNFSKVNTVWKEKLGLSIYLISPAIVASIFFILASQLWNALPAL